MRNALTVRGCVWWEGEGRVGCAKLRLCSQDSSPSPVYLPPPPTHTHPRPHTHSSTLRWAAATAMCTAPCWRWPRWGRGGGWMGWGGGAAASCWGRPRLGGQCSGSVARPLGGHLAATWRPPGGHLAATWRPPGGHLAAIWRPPGGHLAATWRPFGGGRPPGRLAGGDFATGPSIHPPPFARHQVSPLNRTPEGPAWKPVLEGLLNPEARARL